MKKISVIGLTLLAIIGIIAFRRREIQESVPSTAVLPPSEEPASTPAPPRVVASEDETPEPPSDDEKAERNAARPEPGSGENQLEHLFRSVVEANAAQLNLSREQVDRLAADYLEFQEVYAEQARRFLQETSFDPTSVTLRLPPYPMEGKLLRDMFFQRLRTDFPDGKADEIRSEIGGFFDHSFRGFGMTDQTFTITRSAEEPDAFDVRWESKMPENASAAAGGDETTFAGSEGVTTLYREQLMNGEFRFLGNVVDQRFPETKGGTR